MIVLFTFRTIQTKTLVKGRLAVFLYGAYFMLQETIMTHIFNILDCKTLQFDKENSESFLSNYLGIECYDDNHKFWIIFFLMPSLLIYAVLIPCSTIAFSFKKKSELATKNGILKYDYLMRQAFFKNSSVW
jgi:hypothetical protein